MIPIQMPCGQNGGAGMFCRAALAPDDVLIVIAMLIPTKSSSFAGATPGVCESGFREPLKVYERTGNANV